MSRVGQGLPPELLQRIQLEAEENDEIYRQRSSDYLDLSKAHYFHLEMVNRAVKQLGVLKGARILDIGIGDGISSVMMALAGAEVTGIEVSRVALDRSDALARQYGVSVTLKEMAGEDLRFDNDSFDGILCISAFHHMDQELAAGEFSRVLRPGGRLSMIEPLASNPPAWLYRRIGGLFSRQATSEETPLKVRDLRSLRKHFSHVDWQGMYFLSVGLIAMERISKRSMSFFYPKNISAIRWLSPLDSALLRLPGLQRLAWKIGVVARR